MDQSSGRDVTTINVGEDFRAAVGMTFASKRNWSRSTLSSQSLC